MEYLNLRRTNCEPRSTAMYKTCWCFVSVHFWNLIVPVFWIANFSVYFVINDCFYTFLQAEFPFHLCFAKIANKRFARKFFGQSAILDRSDDYGDYATFKQNLLIDLKINTKIVIWSLLLNYLLLSYRFVAIVVIFIVTSEYLIFFNTMIFTCRKLPERVFIKFCSFFPFLRGLAR